MIAPNPVDHDEGSPMAVSEAFLEAGRLKARQHALKLVLRHALAVLDPRDGEHWLQAARGLDYARRLGRQHGFEQQVVVATELIQRLMQLPAAQRAAELRDLMAAIDPPAQKLEAAE
jgi:hypothetical protein